MRTVRVGSIREFIVRAQAAGHDALGLMNDEEFLAMTEGFMNEKMQEIARRFLRYSFEDIEFDYDMLTPREQSLATREEFAELTALVKPVQRADHGGGMAEHDSD